MTRGFHLPNGTLLPKADMNERASQQGTASESIWLQAEDGIRDVVRSRGLGDVDKRQRRGSIAARRPCAHGRRPPRASPVPSTHPTLPTILRVFIPLAPVAPSQ